jgi:hypothetical protein
MILLVYLPSALGLILLSAFAAKNFSKEFHCINYHLGFVFLMASTLAQTSTFLLQIENSPYGAFQLIMVFLVSTAAFTISTVHITVGGQRASLRMSVGLTDDFFKRQKQKWRNQLSDFQSLDDVLDCLDDGPFLPSLFDIGFFNLVVLWSCIMMEKVTDTVVKGIVSKNPAKSEIFKKEDGSPKRYPVQIKNLGYRTGPVRIDKDYEVSYDRLWSIRNDIAHRNYKPTFHETYGALTILISFMENTPSILLASDSMA